MTCIFSLCVALLWRPVLGVPRLSPSECWDRHQPKGKMFAVLKLIYFSITYIVSDVLFTRTE